MTLYHFFLLWLVIGPQDVKEKISIKPFKDVSDQNADFRKDGGDLVQGLLNELQVKLQPYFIVVESENLDWIMQEFESSQSGAVIEKDRISLGSWDGPRYQLTGTITDLGVSTESGQYPVPWVRKTFRLVVTFKIVDIKNRRINYGDTVIVTSQSSTFGSKHSQDSQWPMKLERQASEKIVSKLKDYVAEAKSVNTGGESFVIKITSTPSPANLDVDSLTVGRTPMSLSLKSGIHKVRIYKPGFLEDVFDIKVEKDTEYTRELEAKK